MTESYSSEPRIAAILRLLWLLGCTLAAAALGLLPAVASADSCPNALFRAGPSASLPDCRAYELVSPADTNNYDILFGDDAATARPATAATAITYDSLGAFAGNQAGPTFSQYVSTRGGSGWSTQGISLPAEANSASWQWIYYGFAADLSQRVLLTGDPAPLRPNPNPNHETWACTTAGGTGPQPCATPGTGNLYRRSADGTSVQLITPGEPAAQSGLYPSFAGGSADYSVLAFEDNSALAGVPGAAQGSGNVYEWRAASGRPTVVSCPGPNPCSASNPGVPGVVGSGVNGGAVGTTSRAVSADGSRIYWTRNTGSIYLFDQAAGASTEITASQCTNPSGCTPSGASGSGTYWTASTDGSKAFFTSTDRLTNDSTASGALGDLYMYDANSTPHLTDLTVDNPAGADVQGVIGASGDGSYVYFVANGVLGDGATKGAKPGMCGSGGSCNLYLWHDGATTFIATVEDADSGDGSGADWALTMPAARSFRAQVSADGHYLLYTSTAPVPTQHYKANCSSGVCHSEVWLYATNPPPPGTPPAPNPLCVSCDPVDPNATAQGDAVLAQPSHLQFSALLETANNMSLTSGGNLIVFFETRDKLVKNDTNGIDDVYEWEAPSPGVQLTCSGDNAVMQDGNCISLISSGSSPYPSYFENATPSGNDVFFLARDPLVPQDTQGNQALFDARVDGGFPAPATPPAPCSGDVCHGAPTPAPEAPTAATITFVGPGNAAPGSVTPMTRPTVKVLHRVIHGTFSFVRVTVLASGVITVNGRWLRSVRLRVPRAGTYSLRVPLSAQGRRALARRHTLTVSVTIGYQATGAQDSSTTVRITFVRRQR